VPALVGVFTGTMGFARRAIRSAYYLMMDNTITLRLNTGFLKSVSNNDDWVNLYLKHHSNPNALPVPSRIAKPSYCTREEAPNSTAGDAEIHQAPVIAAMRKTCRIAANVLNKCEQLLQPGTSTDELNQFAHNEIIKANAYPSPLKYFDYPKSIFASPNNVIGQGIPNARLLTEGDILTVDIFVYANGVHGNCTKTYLIGDVPDELQTLNAWAELCTDEIVALCAPGVPFCDVAKRTQRVLDETYFRVVPEFTAHGIGKYLSGPPTISYQENDDRRVMEPGMIFTIGPILVGLSPSYDVWPNGWTTATLDHHASAQFRDTILITENGREVLTTPG